MFEGRWVAVVVPAYNEEKLVGRVLETMPALVDRIVIVDDASTDRTWEILSAARERLGCRLQIIRHDRNAGVGGAIVTGYEAVMQGNHPTRGLVDNNGEVSGMSLTLVVPSLSRLLVKCYFRRMKEKYIIRDFHPLIFFLTFGLFLVGGGLLFGIYLIYLRLAVGTVSPNSAIFDAFCLIMGMQMLFFAMWMDMEHNKGLK